MVGRERELNAGARLLMALSTGPACLVLEGEAGIGKTTVWREIVARASAMDVRLLSCRPAAAEAKMSFAALADLLATVDRALFLTLPAPQRHALEVALLETDPDGAVPDRRAVFAGFSSLLFALAEQGPLLVAVDDLQWLDRPSQAALEFALRRFGHRRIGFLCSVRFGEGASLEPGLDRALDESEAERVRLESMSIGALHELLAERLGQSLPRPTLAKLAAASRGNPFYALELAREMTRRGALAPGEALPVPDDFSDLVQARIRRLPRRTRRELLAAASLSTPAVELLDRTALEPAERAGLIEITAAQVAFSHPLFASAVYRATPAPERREIHRRLAELVREPEERARHLALGAEKSSEEIAVELERAAERALSRGAPDAAGELLELAARLTPHGGEHSAVRTLKAADCHFHAGDRARARLLAEDVLSAEPHGTVRGHALQILGEVRYHEDSYVEAIPLFEEALSLLTDERRAIELYVNLSIAQFNTGNIAQEVAYGTAAIERATRLGDDGLLAVALANAALADVYLGRPVDRARIESALALEDTDQQLLMPMRPSLIAGFIEFLSDNMDRAGTLFNALRDRTVERGEDADLPALDANLALVQRCRGNLRSALEFANEGYEL